MCVAGRGVGVDGKFWGTAKEEDVPRKREVQRGPPAALAARGQAAGSM